MHDPCDNLRLRERAHDNTWHCMNFTETFTWNIYLKILHFLAI